MLVIFNSSPPDVDSITIGCPIERVESLTHLGIKISNDLTSDLHVAHTIKNAQGLTLCPDYAMTNSSVWQGYHANLWLQDKPCPLIRSTIVPPCCIEFE